EEPYSIAITIADSLSFADAWNVEILATDVGRHALKHAERGIYKGRSIASVSEKQLANHFTEVAAGQQVKPRLGKMMSFAQMNLHEASETLQYLREYVSVLQDVEPRREDLERLYISAHTLSRTSASYGFPRFSEIAGKLAPVFQYALNAPLGNDLHGPLTEFLSDGISLLETDLLEISDTGKENVDDIAVFKERYRFAFPAETPPS